MDNRVSDIINPFCHRGYHGILFYFFNVNHSDISCHSKNNTVNITIIAMDVYTNVNKIENSYMSRSMLNFT